MAFFPVSPLPIVFTGGLNWNPFPNTNELVSPQSGAIANINSADWEMTGVILWDKARRQEYKRMDMPQFRRDSAYTALCGALVDEPILDVNQVIFAPCGCMHLALNLRGDLEMRLVVRRIPPPSFLPPRRIMPPAPSQRPLV